MQYRVNLVEGDGSLVPDHRLGEVFGSYDYGVVIADLESGTCIVDIQVPEDPEKLERWEGLGHVRSRVISRLVQETKGRGKNKRVVSERTVVLEQPL